MRVCRLLTIIAAIFVATSVVPQLFSTAAFTKGKAREPFAPTLKPGDYVWRPEVSPAGPVVILVSIPDQVMYVYRNGVRIGRSTVSTGKPGKRTPSGVFTVLQKKVEHESSIYKGAKMPHMQRLTWSGIAMHAGQLPGYPASAGCVRMPEDFAEKLYSITSLGTTVIIADQNSATSTTTNPGLLFSGKRESPPGADFFWEPEKAPKGPVSIIISTRDRTGFVYRNGVEIGRAPISGIERVSGTHVYSALGSVDSSGRRDWIATASISGRTPNLKRLANQLTVSPTFLNDVRALIIPGTTLVLTDASVGARTHSAQGFKILTAD